MSINPIFSSRASGTTGSSSATNSAVQQGGANATLDQQAFLQLLSTQLSNQDPTAPQDNTQFLAQLAQFSTLQGVNNLASSQSQSQAASLLGKTVSGTIVANNSSQNVSGTVTAVRWDSSGVTLTLNDKNQSELTMAQVTQVSSQ